MSKIEVIKFQPEHANEIRDRNIKEGRITDSCLPGVSWDECVKAWMNGPAYTLIIDDEVIASSGICLIGWQRGEAWTLVSSLFYKYKKTCYKLIKNILVLAAKKENLRRVQSVIDLNLSVGDSWMEHLGFQKEGILRKFGPLGEDKAIFSRVF